MREFKVTTGSPARLIHLQKAVESPFAVSRDLTFTEDDLVIDPSVVGHGAREYGFKTGTPDQRKKYLLVIDLIHVQIEGDEE